MLDPRCVPVVLEMVNLFVGSFSVPHKIDSELSSPNPILQAYTDLQEEKSVGTV